MSKRSSSSSSYSHFAADSARNSLKRTRQLFDGRSSSRTESSASLFVPTNRGADADSSLAKAAQARRLVTQYGYSSLPASSSSSKTSGNSNALVAVSTVTEETRGSSEAAAAPAEGGLLIQRNERDESTTGRAEKHSSNEGVGRILVKSAINNIDIPTPTWHAPWKLATVLSSHLGWVRSIAFDPTNDMFATGGSDRVIKIWDLAKASVGTDAADGGGGGGALKITLTGHISPIRAMAFSDRHPYLFSAGEDKQVKCWDLETNQVIRHYHGHLSGVFCLALHPTLDVMVTGGRDAVARVWDIRTKQQVHVLTGHSHTVASVLTRSMDPQVITGSHDCTIKLWDLAAGKCQTTLTHHLKSVRALCQPSFESTFLSGSADGLKKWQARDGRFLKTFTGHKSVINALAVNDDGVVASGGDEGSLHFWDYRTGHSFQQTQTVAQPGSLEAENGIYAAAFDLTGTRLVTGEADKTVKIWKPNEEASELTHPIDMAAWRKKCLAEAKQRY